MSEHSSTSNCGIQAALDMFPDRTKVGGGSIYRSGKGKPVKQSHGDMAENSRKQSKESLRDRIKLIPEGSLIEIMMDGNPNTHNYRGHFVTVKLGKLIMDTTGQSGRRYRFSIDHIREIKEVQQ